MTLQKQQLTAIRIITTRNLLLFNFRHKIFVTFINEYNQYLYNYQFKLKQCQNNVKVREREREREREGERESAAVSVIDVLCFPRDSRTLTVAGICVVFILATANLGPDLLSILWPLIHLATAVLPMQYGIGSRLIFCSCENYTFCALDIEGCTFSSNAASLSKLFTRFY